MDAATWARYSTLLDEALDLAPQDREAWLTALARSDATAATTVGDLLRRALAAGADQSQAATLNPAFPEWLLATAESPRPPQWQAGQSIGHWRLVQPLGRGGMGEVWLAKRSDGLYAGKAALKFIRSGLSPALFAGRFARERAVLARLAHPSIAHLLDAGLAGDQPYLVLEYIEGEPLMQYAAGLHLGGIARLRLLLDAARAVEHAHAQLVVHCDLKPSNLLVTDKGEVKLLDFGVAALLDEDASEHTLTRLTGRGFTPGYAAPEQVLGESRGVTADVFALGALLYELLAGRRPFAPETQQRVAIEHAVLHREPLPLSRVLKLAGRRERRRFAGLDPVLAKALAKAPQDRYVNVAAFIDDLQRWLEHRPLTATALSWTQHSGLWLRRNRVVATAVALVLLSLAGGLAAALHQRSEALRQAARSSAMADYLLDTLSAADPDAPSDTPASLDRLLQRAADGVATRFGDDVQSQARLLLRLVTIHNDFNQPEAALPLAERAWQAHVQAFGSGHDETGWARRHWAETLYGTGHYREAIEQAGAAAAIAQAQAPPDLDLLHDALVMEQFARMKQGRFASANAVLDRYEALVRQHFADVPVYPALAAQFRGNLLREEGRWAEAERRFAEANAIIEPSGTRFWRVRLLLDIELAAAQAQQRDDPAARAALAQLIEQSRRRLGSTSRITQTAQAAFAAGLARADAHEAALGAWAELAQNGWQPGRPSHPLLLRAQAEWLVERQAQGEPGDALQAEAGGLHKLLAALPETSTDALLAGAALAHLAERIGLAGVAADQAAMQQQALDRLGAEAGRFRELRLTR